jgi:cell division protein FtsB
MILMRRVKNTMVKIMNSKIQMAWEKTVFFGSIFGLLFLFGVSMFRYYYLIPAQKEVSRNTEYIHQLEQENAILKKENKTLKKQLEHVKD